MDNCGTEAMDKAVRQEVLRLLGDRVKNPTLRLEYPTYNMTAPENQAFQMLTEANYLRDDGRITLAGMDYYRKETDPLGTWLKANWFAVFVAVLTTLGTILAAACG